MEKKDRLKLARVKAGHKSVSDAARAMGVKIPTYTSHENGTRDFDEEAARTYARRLKVPVEWLTFGRGSIDGSERPEELSVIRDPFTRIKIVGLVQGGYWAEPDEDRAPQDEFIDVPLPEIYRSFQKFGLRVQGNSMNLVYPEGTLLICASLYELHEEEPIAGKKYIVERVKPDGRREVTVKELMADVHGKWWLWPRSNDPEHQEPIPFDAVDGDTVQVQARVIFSIKPE